MRKALFAIGREIESNSLFDKQENKGHARLKTSLSMVHMPATAQPIGGRAHTQFDNHNGGGYGGKEGSDAHRRFRRGLRSDGSVPGPLDGGPHRPRRVSRQESLLTWSERQSMTLKETRHTPKSGDTTLR